MPKPSVAVRLGTEGKAQVKNDFAEVGAAGEASAKRLGDAFDREAEKADRARQRMAATAAKIAAILPQTAVQMQISDAVGSGYSQPEGSARRSAQAFAELAAAQEKLEQRTHAFRMALDPLYAAQARFNGEMAEARSLMAAGAITLDVYNDKLRAEQQALTQAARAQQLHGAMTGEARAGMQQLTMNLNDMATMWAMGASTQQIFVSQMGQNIQALQLMSGGTSRFAAFMGGPWGAAITVGTIALIPLVSKLLEGETALKKAELAANGLGDAQGALGQMFDLTTGKLKDQNDMLRLNIQLTALNLRNEAFLAGETAKSTTATAGRINLSRNPMLGTAYGMFASPNGNAQPAYGKTLAQAMLEGVMAGKIPGSAAQKWGERADFSNSSITREQFFAAVVAAVTQRAKSEMADKMDSSLSAGKLDPAFLRSNVDTPEKPRVDRRAETLARESEATESLIVNLGKLADAYLDSDAAALKAEIVARATEQGIKKRADLTAYVAQQERKVVAERTVDAAKSVAGLRAENDARQIVNGQVLQGAMNSQEAERFLRNEAQLRPYIAAAALAEGDAKAKLLKIVQALRQEQDRSDQQMGRERAGRMIADQKDALEIADQELALVGKSVAERERVVSTLRLKQQMQREGIDLESEEGRRILANHALILQKNEAVARAADDWREVQRIGENFVDTVLNPDNWKNFGDLGKQVLHDLMNDMFRLAAINPIKNMLFGSELPVLGGVLGQSGNVGNGIVSGDPANSPAKWLGAIGKTFGFAAGTEYFAGGLARVGEHGEETVMLPAGSKILTAGETRRMMGGGGMNVPITISIDATGADAGGLARVEMQLDQLRRDLPGTIVSTVNDARQRGYVVA